LRLGRKAPKQVVRAIRRYWADTPFRERFMTGLVVVFGVVVALGGFFLIQSYTRSQAQHEFQGPANQFAATLSEAIDGYVGLVESAGALFGSADKVDRWAFFEFSGKTLPNHPGVRALEWIPRVPATQRRAYEERATGDGIFDFRINEHQIAEEHKHVKAAARPDYYPIYYVEPFEGNEQGIGFDLATDGAVWAAMTWARDTGKMVATRRDPSDWKPDGQAEFAVLLPIYGSEIVPFTVEERRKKLIGYVRAVYRLGDLIAAALPGLAVPPGLDVYVFDEIAGPKNSLLHYHPSPLRPGPSAPLPEADAVDGLFNATLYDLAGWSWKIVLKPVPSHFTRNVESASWGFVAFVLLVTALLFQYLVWSQTRTREIERSVTERTAALRSEITERKRIETELRSAKDQAEVANRAKSEFLAMMSHELRTPLNAVIGFAEIMSGQFFGPLGSEQYRRYAEDIHMSGRHLLSLINDILDLSKIEANRFELHEEVLSIARVWGAVQSILQESIASARLKLEADISNSLPGLRADQRAVRQILINLLSNAVKFTPEGGRITVAAEIDAQGRFVISVADTGIGISEQDLADVVLPFKQVDSSLARRYEGTGLGLPLIHRLIEMHDGQLEIESVLGVGTTVRAVFPEQRVAAGQPQVDNDGILEQTPIRALKQAAAH
jgi:signal transduction histidine kinase